MATVTSVYTFLCNCVYGHVLSCTERSVQACHGNAFGVRSRKQRRRKKKLAIYRAWPWISNCWEWDPNSGLSGLESSALTTLPRRTICVATRRHTYCSSTNQCLQTLTTEKKTDSHFKTRSLSGTSNKFRTLYFYIWCIFRGIIRGGRQKFAIHNLYEFQTAQLDFAYKTCLL